MLRTAYVYAPSLAGEHGDVEQVQDGAEDAHHEAEIAVDAPVLLREVVQVAAHPAVTKIDLLGLLLIGVPDVAFIFCIFFGACNVTYS